MRRPPRRWLLLAALLGLLFPGQAEAPRDQRHRAEWLPIDGGELRVLRAGRGDTTLLFLHGFGESLLSWHTILDQFTGGYRVVAVDAPGFGLSRVSSTRWDLPQYRLWMREVLATIPGPVIVVGHSMGGELAAALALDRPDRVVALVLLAPAGAGISPLLTDTSGTPSPMVRWASGALDYVLPASDSMWLVDPPDTVRPGTENPPVLEQFDFAGLAGQFTGIHQPVLLLWGRQDHTIPIEIGERIAAELPCRRLIRLTGLHRLHQTAADTVVVEMKRFLRHPTCGAAE